MSRVPVLLGRTGLVAAVMALLVIVLPAPPGPLAGVFGALLLVAMVADWIVTPRPQRFTVQRHHSDILSIGERSTVGWSVSNPTARRVRVRLADDLMPSLGAPGRRCALVLPPAGRATGEVALHPSRRGLFAIPGVTLRVEGPLGLAGRQAYIPVPTELSVYPSLEAARSGDLWVRKSQLSLAGMRVARHEGGGTDFDHLREYVPGDEFRWIDWAASARSPAPVVRRYRAEVDQRLVCLLDGGRTMTGRIAGVSRFEHALDGLLMLTAVSARLGDRSGLVVFDESVRAIVPPARAAGQVHRVAEAVYRIQPSLIESDYHRAFAYVLARFPRHSMLVIFSELVESAVAESLVPALGLVAQKHRVVVAAVSDPSVEIWAEEPPAGEEEMYRKAAARWTLERRRRTAAMLRARGVTVVDAAPSRFPRAVTDVYVKARAVGGQ